MMKRNGESEQREESKEKERKNNGEEREEGSLTENEIGL